MVVVVSVDWLGILICLNDLLFLEIRMWFFLLIIIIKLFVFMLSSMDCLIKGVINVFFVCSLDE